MNSHRFDFSIRHSVGQLASAKAVVVAVAALASLGAILFAGNPAEAKPVSPDSCEKKRAGCYFRCQDKFDINKLGTDAWATKVVACQARTCNKQYNNRMASAGPGKLETPGGIRQPRGADAWGPNIIDTRKDEYQGRPRPTGAYSPVAAASWTPIQPFLARVRRAPARRQAGAGRRPRRPRLGRSFAEREFADSRESLSTTCRRLPGHLSPPAGNFLNCITATEGVKTMKTIAYSNIATRFGAICAFAVAGALLAGSITPAAAHKGGGGGGKHGNHQPHKPPQNPGPIGPLPKPPAQGQWHATPKPVVVRDHRTPKVITTSGGGVKVTSTPTVNDHRVKPVVRDQRGGVQCLGNMCGVTKTVKTAVGGVIKSVKRTVGNGIKIAKNGNYPGRPPIPR